MAAPDLVALCDDLAAEHADLDRFVASIGEADWDTATPAADWTIRDQIHHLGWFDHNGVLAITDPDAFASKMSEMIGDFERFESSMREEARSFRGAELLAWWRDARSQIVAALRSADPSARVPWYGPPMALPSFATARLMETWAHGQDIVDSLRVTRTPTTRLRHIAHIGVRTRGFSYAVRDRVAPEGEVRVELDAPDGSTWTWGSEGLTDRVTGSALDFCLVVTQRRHVDDTALEIEGPLATEWMSIAQAFAGSPGSGRKPGQFA